MTKKSLTLCCAFLAFFMSSYVSLAQGKTVPLECGASTLLETLKKTDPGVIPSIQQLEGKITKFYENSRITPQQKSSPNSSLIIPVVITVVHNGGLENISDAQVLSQINVLNDYFDVYGLQFCLATANGSTTFQGSTPGIFRVQNANLMNHSSADITSLMATSNLSPARYLRIWVVNDIISGNPNTAIQGYGTFPASYSNPNNDGIVMRFSAFGNQATCNCSSLNPQTNQGKVLVHEVGHYLGLFHTFEGGCLGMNTNDCASAGDYVCDTPPVNQPNTGCPSTPPNSCNESYGGNLPDDINNFMDYTNESCLNSFTDGQKSRMYATISQGRSLLVESANHVYTGINCAPAILPGFTVSNYAPCVGTNVSFTATSINNATYEWDFGDGTSAVGQTVQHTYTSAYSPAVVVLTVTVGVESASVLQKVVVTACSPIQDAKAHWYFCDRNALDFSSGAPVFDNSAVINNTFNIATSAGSGPNSESAAAQSDVNGDLLFYTDGINVWDFNHQLINPSTPLGGHTSSNNGVLIVPTPGNSSEYYVFTSCDAGVTNRTGLTYSKISVAGNSVQLVSGQVNIPVTVPAALDVRLANSGAIISGEGVTAVAKQDGYHILVEAMNLNRTGSYIVRFELTASSLQYGDAYSIYSWSTQMWDLNSDAFELKVSPNGKHIAIKGTLANPLKVLDFDPCTGVISNPRNINNLNLRIAFSFSPDSRFLYGVHYVSTSDYRLYQFNVENPVITAVEVSPVFSNLLSVELGPDNKIYMSGRGTSLIETIHLPNVECTPSQPNACLYVPNGPAVFGSPNLQSLNFALPNGIDANYATVYSNEISAIQAVGDCFTFEFEAGVCGTSYLWDFGDPQSGVANTSNLTNPEHSFSAPGTYTVTLVSGNNTITKVIEVAAEPEFTGTTTICPANSMTANYSFSVPSGYICSWAATNGTINGVNTQSNVDVTWTSLPAILELSMTNLANGCETTTLIDITELCEEPCLDDAEIIVTEEPNCTFAFDILTSTSLPNGYVTYLWSFGDGSTSTQAQPSHAYTNSGLYTVCVLVKVFNDKGVVICEKELCKNIKVNCAQSEECLCEVKPEILYTFDKEKCIFSFTAISGVPECNKYVNYYWDFGDGTTSLGQYVNHTYSTPGSYTVTLIVEVTDKEGKSLCKKEVTQNVEVECEGRCECDFKPEILFGYAYDAETYCNLHLQPQITTACTNILSITWYVDNVAYPPTQDIYLDINVNQSYEICMVVEGMGSDGKICKEKVCVDYFKTDCYPIPTPINSPFEKGSDKNDFNFDEIDMILYPNPASDRMVAEFKTKSEEPLKLVVRSMQGELLQEMMIDSEDQNVSIDVSRLSSGVYTLEVIGKSFKMNKRFVVTH